MNLIKWALLLVTPLFCFAPLSAQKTDAQLLAQAYKDNDLQKLTQFCKNWQSELPPITNEELSGLNDTLKQAYQLFSDFFARSYGRNGTEQPRQLAKKDTPFYIVQNSLEVFVGDQQIYFSQRQVDSVILVQVSASLPDSLKNLSYSSDQELDSLLVRSCLWCKEGSSPLAILRTYRDNYSVFHSRDYWKKGRLIDTIKDFRPHLSSNIHWLYWSKNKYEQIVHLTYNPSKKQKTDPFNADNILRFLRKEIDFIPAYTAHKPEPNEVYYVFPGTSNYIPTITFDKKLEYALVTLSLMGFGQTDIWHHQNNHWEYVSTITRYTAQE